MRRIVWGGFACAGIAIALAAAMVALDRDEDAGSDRPGGRLGGDTARNEPTASGRPADRESAGAKPTVPLFSAGFIDDSGYELALNYTPAIADRGSLAEVAAACGQRTRRGRADIGARLASLERLSPRPPDFDQRRAMLQIFAGLLGMYEGKFDEAQSWFGRALRDNPGLDSYFRMNIGAMRGVAALRRGEIENCVACLGPSSCIFPIAAEARHLKPDGSREAIRWFNEYLDKQPEDLGVRWLLHIAAMTLGEYPAGVPAEYRIPPGSPGAGSNAGRFVNVAPEVGLASRGPNMLGASIFDDFTGDGLPDIFVTSGDWDLDASLFVNRGDGTFKDTAASAGLAGQVLAVNAAQADYDNDGWLDVVALRGGWETPYRLSLLRNTGRGVFEDVTVSSGLGEPIASQSAAWGDYDNDGLLDLFVAGEFRDQPLDPRNHCRLYRNRGDGTFVDVAALAGVQNQRWAKGASWGDYDSDGFLDLYVSNMNGENRLYRNNRNGTFTDVAPKLGLTEPLRSFSCWFWDYDNDGRLDLFVTGFGAWLNDIVADRLGRPTEAERPRLYHNLGEGRFRDTTAEAGLDHVFLPMGSNFADFDNDGYLDFYLATGRPAYSILVPNLLFRNLEGRCFEDVTTASGTGHLQKGHGVSFADYDDDGDLDLFVEVGGQTPGDRAHNVLFRNPGHGHHFVGMKLVGTKVNRSAIGAKVRLDLVLSDGGHRSIHRIIGGGSSFGGNSLAPTIGLGDAKSIKTLTVSWPGSGAVQTFGNLAMDQSIEITEGAASYRVVPRGRAKSVPGK
jgi:hypothetical protein